MRKLILKMSVSVDGFVGGPNGEIDWLLKSMDDESAKWTSDTIWQAGVHIMGSRTFHDMMAYWPYTTEPFAAPMNEIPKIAFSKKGIKPGDEALTTMALRDAKLLQGNKQAPAADAVLAEWAKTPILTGDLRDEIIRLKQQPGKDIIAHGGASFAQSLVKTGLIDEYRLLVHPVALGTGLPLFSALEKPLYLQLIDTVAFKGGAVAHVYRSTEK
ncbi:dihydrofolate reductase family protein [Mucilaginibacter sp. McL0603]|uniref:dihydrofolate reductase family protein n=1 Tax=Mucilaginibacter sp. McL0603 TaxID=3415670 RepID=UPI003CE82D5A